MYFFNSITQILKYTSFRHKNCIILSKFLADDLRER